MRLRSKSAGEVVWSLRGIPRSSTSLCLLLLALSHVHGQRLRSTYQTDPASQPHGEIRAVQASSTKAFLDSIGVATHFGGGYSNTPYRQKTSALIDALVQSGIRHIRDGGTYHNDDYRKMAAAGVRINLVLDPKIAIIPTRDYWCDKYGNKDCILIADYLKSLGPGVVDTVESLNEVNGFYKGIKWHAGKDDEITDVPGDPNRWINYAVAYTKDTCTAIHRDPALASVKCLPPALTGSSPILFRDSEFSGVADYGAIHPYPYAGNGHGTPVLVYDNSDDYFHWTTTPAINIDEYPWWIDTMGADVRSQQGRSVPLIATETGYYTGTGPGSIPEAVQGKYVPRTFAEYFRHAIVRTFWYELIDEAQHPVNPEASYGLLHNDLTPKPGYLALQSLISLLKDSDGNGTEKQASLSYGITVQAAPAFTRTQYVHDLLLQKSNGTFYLLLWHEISDVATRTKQGRLPSTDVELNAPPMDTAISLPPTIEKATVYTYDSQWRLKPGRVTARPRTLRVPAADTISVIELVPRGGREQRQPLVPSRLALSH
jgi:hypothetical protein